MVIYNIPQECECKTADIKHCLKRPAPDPHIHNNSQQGLIRLQALHKGRNCVCVGLFFILCFLSRTGMNVKHGWVTWKKIQVFCQKKTWTQSVRLLCCPKLNFEKANSNTLQIWLYTWLWLEIGHKKGFLDHSNLLWWIFCHSKLFGACPKPALLISTKVSGHDYWTKLT